MNKNKYYFQVLYPFQDQVSKEIHLAETEFFLTGGTAASRGYLNHRFSDDLDLFVNDDHRFGLWAESLIQALSRQATWEVSVDQKEERFAGLTVTQAELTLKVEMINDVPAHVGSVV